MRIPRIFQAVPLKLNTEICLDEPAREYVRTVLRLPLGAMVTLFNGLGGEFQAKVTAITRQAITLRIETFIDRASESPLAIHLGQAISRGDRMDYTIQKSVELGVSDITPLFTERCNVHLSNERLQKRMRHWQGIIASACEQSGRNRLPILHTPQRLSDWLGLVTADLCLVLNPHASQIKQIQQLTPASLALLIGPEGGLSEVEINMALQERFQGLRLGPRILRTETAALAAISILQCWWGDFIA
jgi:16S rRNA (uracil1498-N3)-methyltransferase